MTASYTYDGDDLLTVRHRQVEFRQCAELGAVGGGQITVHDKPGTLEIIGQKDFAADEDDCADPISFRGFVAERDFKRGPSMGPTERDIDISLHDLNAMLGFRRLRQKTGMTSVEAGDRPAETVAQRGAWLMASPFVVGLFTDEGRCEFPADKGMDEADYRQQFPGDVLADMALAS